MGHIKRFAHRMNRAEVLHAISYNIELRWKNAAGEFKFVKLIENQRFQKKTTRFPP